MILHLNTYTVWEQQQGLPSLQRGRSNSKVTLPMYLLKQWSASPWMGETGPLSSYCAIRRLFCWGPVREALQSSGSHPLWCMGQFTSLRDSASGSLWTEADFMALVTVRSTSQAFLSQPWRLETFIPPAPLLPTKAAKILSSSHDSRSKGLRHRYIVPIP